MITISDFQSLLNKEFAIQFSDQDVELVLEEVKSTGKPYKDGAREPFSLIFSADASRGVLKQGNYEFHNSAMGATRIFIVPVGVQDNVCHYQAIYN